MYATCMIVNVIKDLLIGEKSKVIKKSLREKCVVSFQWPWGSISSLMKLVLAVREGLD
ncbi:predicted protein [Botrytis cinerea T4]|uniref:Uncharacterized protein n=1 Tax=Botryotinia fuckeliana (strain T4) TaxID=999810 RepID=G2YSM0_BOTF4|nr:predicted protein [Botrytis cinerea T4]